MLRVPARNSCLSARVSRSRFCIVIVIHQQLVPFRPTHFQAHLVLETNLPFRLILYWITLLVLKGNDNVPLRGQ